MFVRNGVDGGKVHVNHRRGIVGTWYAVAVIGGMHAVVWSLGGEIIGMTGFYSNSGAAVRLNELLCPSLAMNGNKSFSKSLVRSECAVIVRA